MSYSYNDLSSLKKSWLAYHSNIPRRFWGWEPSDIEKDLGEFDPRITTWISDALAGEIIMKPGALGTTGVGLLFDGKPGRGKTTHAVITLTEFVRRLPEDAQELSRIFRAKPEDVTSKFRPVYYLTWVELLLRKKALINCPKEDRELLFEEMEGFHGRSKHDHLNVRILFLDDLGKEYGTKYDDYSFDEVVRTRYDRGLPTIITTNVAQEDWDKQYSEAMGSFSHEAFQRITLDGKDLRR